jgi:drug/metabolite transporter (DMT)-like permease
LGNVFGLLMSYTAARLGKVSIVGPITSTEGAIAAVIAVVAGEALAPGAGLVLAAIVVGVVLASREPDPESGPTDAPIGRIVAFALGAAVAFGVSIYATGRVADALPIAWAILPARLAGVLIVALPLLLRGGIGVTRSALPFVVASGIAEVGGVVAFAIGSRDSIAVTAVIASQFPAIAGIGAFFLFHERLSRVQLLGVVVVAVGVAVLAAMRS